MGRTPASAKRLITPAESLSRALHPILIQTSTIPPKNTTTKVTMVPAMTIRCIPPALSSVAASEVFMPSCNEFKMGFKKIKLKYVHMSNTFTNFFTYLKLIYNPSRFHIDLAIVGYEVGDELGQRVGGYLHGLQDVTNKLLSFCSTNKLLTSLFRWWTWRWIEDLDSNDFPLTTILPILLSEGIKFH